MLEMKVICDLDLIDSILFFHTFLPQCVFCIRLCCQVASYLGRKYYMDLIACTFELVLKGRSIIRVDFTFQSYQKNKHECTLYS